MRPFLALLGPLLFALVAIAGPLPSARQEGGELADTAAAARTSLEAWLETRGGRTGARISLLSIDLPGWSFFSVSRPPQAGLEELGEETVIHVVRRDGAVVTGPAEDELARVFRSVGLIEHRPGLRLEELARAVLALAGRRATVLSDNGAADLAGRFAGIDFAGPRLERTPNRAELTFQAQVDAGASKRPLAFLLVRVTVGLSYETSLSVEEREARFR